MSVFTQANELIRKVEAHLVKEQDNTIPIYGSVKRIIWLPIKFLKMGVDEKFRGAFSWSILSFLFMMLGNWLIQKSNIAQTELANIVLLGAMVMPLFLVTFAMPSTYGHSYVSKKAIDLVMEYLHDLNISTTRDIDLLQKSLQKFEARCQARVNALKWLVGLLWAGFIYAYSKAVDMAVADPSSTVPMAFDLAIFLLSISGGYLCVWGYDAALNRLFRTIDFGCHDYCLMLQQAESK